jgi:hypothetical protein
VKRSIATCHVACRRLRWWRLRQHRLGRHDVSLSSTTAYPPQPDEKLRLIEQSDVLNEGKFGKISGFWQSSGSGSASRDFDEPIDNQQDDEVAITRTTHGTPSARLLSALREARLSGLIPRHLQNKLDLSFFDVRTLEAAPASARWSRPPGLSKAENVMTLSDGLAAYITYILVPTTLSSEIELLPDTVDHEALSKVYTPKYLKLLQEKGYQVEDVVIWSWIVTSKSADQATKRLFAISTKLSKAGRTPVPLFIYLLILRSRNVSAASLKLVMNMLWARTPDFGVHHQPFSHQIQVPEQSAVILIVRLIRHARKVWPESFGEIVSLMTQLIGYSHKDALPMKSERAQRLCHIYNRVLALLALPASAHPFRAVALQQRAQFRLLRKMNQFEPKLPVTREGFRALAKVQIAHKKTDMERRWARFKALSWPPWKENKLGLDAESGSAGSVSRAIDVLSRMGESGYNSLSWEKQARVLAGWDTDRSPTIQRRKLLGRAPLMRSITSLDDGLSADSDREHEIWAARISATRTVKEAWACFCSFEKECANNGLEVSRQTPGRLAPWHAMFERLLYATRDIPGDHVDPGDGKETYPEPTSPHDFLYVPTEPPSVGELYNKMIVKGLKPAGRLLADLIDHAPTISQGLKYISQGMLTEIKKDVLLNAEKYHPAYIRRTLSSIPDFLLAAFVRLLTRARYRELELYPPTSGSSMSIHQSGLPRKIRVAPYVYATQLITISATPYLPAWHALFAGLLRQLRNSKFKKDAQHEHVYRIWLSTQDLLQAMASASTIADVPCLQAIYQISEEAMICSPHLASAPGRGTTADITDRATLIVKRLFHNIVIGYQDPRSSMWLPTDPEASLLTVPSPANLPGLVRVLGIAGDSEDILCLLRWMSRFATELESVSKEVSNGERMLRRTLITMRVFLERSWTEHDSRSATLVSQSLVDEARQLVQQHARWGGWPTDGEVEDYMKKTKRVWIHRMRELEKARAAVNNTEVEDKVSVSPL